MKEKINQQFKIISLWVKQLRCKHTEWDCDTQIRTIECKHCGKRAWIKNYRSLYK